MLLGEWELECKELRRKIFGVKKQGANAQGEIWARDSLC